jgi:[ribosomal protein S18]-alanine N-acetyltransferase
VTERNAEERRRGGAEGTSDPASPPLPGSSAPPVLLRKVLPEDFEALYRLDGICFEEGIAYSRAELSRFLSVPSAEGVVAEDAGEIAGFAIGYLARGRIAHVVTLDVHPRRRRRGLGSALLDDLLGRFSKAGAREARLEVSVENPGAIAFYVKLGYLRGRVIRDYYGAGRHAYEMSKPLTR